MSKRSTKAESLEDHAARIRRALEHQFGDPAASTVDGPWVVVTFPDYLVVSLGGVYYRVTFAEADGATTFSARAEWVPVEERREWVDVVKAIKAGRRHSGADMADIQGMHDMSATMHETAVKQGAECRCGQEHPEEGEAPDAEKTLVAFGGAVKALGGGRIGGYLVRFSGPDDPDLTGDFFDAATDYGPHETSPVLYHHGFDPVLRGRVLGTATHRRDEFGVWAETQLALRDEYEQFIYGQAEAGKLGWSSGTAAHRVGREPKGKAHHITVWPLGLDASLTPAPAEPRNAAIPLKAYLAQSPPDQAGQPAPDGAREGRRAQIQIQRSEGAMGSQEVKHIMGENTENTAQVNAAAPAPPAAAQDLEAKMAALSAVVERLTRHMQEEPAIRQAGYYTTDGGKADPSVKSFGDFLLAVRRGDATRLKAIYGAVKDMSSETGGAGGYGIPTTFNTELMQIAAQASYLLGASGVQQFQVGTPAGTWPALDQFAAPTAGAGNTALAARVTTSKRAQGGAYTETQPQLEQIKYLVNDACSGAVQAPKELRVDSAIAIDSLLRTLIGIAVQSKCEYYILRGNGVGEPLGIMNAPAAVGISPDTNSTFAFADAVEMVSRHKNVSGRPSVWVEHPGTIVDIAAFQVATSSPATLVTTLGGPLPRNLLGYGLVDSEHLAQMDNAGHIMLIDPGAYALFVLGGLYIDFSEHAAFLNGLDTWRFGLRCDGQPWWKGTVTLADPQGGFTVSPFVYFND